MIIKLMQPGEENAVIDLVKEVFDNIIAPGYTSQGISEFYKFANKANLSKRSKTDHFTITASENSELIGIIEIREYSHVSMFFVKKKFQGSGIGSALFKEAVKTINLKNDNLKELTVNSSLNAVKTYERLGFSAKSGEQCFNGIRFIPMKLVFDK